MATSALAGQQLVNSPAAAYAATRFLPRDLRQEDAELVIDALSDAGYQLVDTRAPGVAVVRGFDGGVGCTLCTRRVRNARWFVGPTASCSLHLVRALRAARRTHAPSTPLGRNTSA